MKTWNRRGGFTLIELLAVIAMVLLLASLLFPAIGSAHKMAKVAVCRSNLRQLGVGIMLYAGDHSGQLTRYAGPQAVMDEAAPNGGYTYWSWFHWSNTPGHANILAYYDIESGYRAQLEYLWNQKYVRDSRVFYCPADPYFHATKTGDVGYTTGGFFKYADGKVGQSYWFNPMQVFRIPDQQTWRWGNQQYTPMRYSTKEAILLMDPLNALHDGRWNLLHLDGSADTRRSQELLDRIQLGVNVAGGWAQFDSSIQLLIAPQR